MPESVGGRITAVLAALLAVVLVIVGVATWESRQQTDSVQDSRTAFEVSMALHQGALTWLYSDSLVGRYIITPSEELRATIHATEQTALEHLETARRLESDKGDPEDVAGLEEIRRQADQGIATHERTIDAADAGDPVAAAQILLAGIADSELVTGTFTQVIASETQHVAGASDHSEDISNIVTILLVAAAIVVVLAGSAAGLAISGSVVRPLSQLGEAAAAFGRGDLAARAPDTGPREIRRLAAALNGMAASLGRRDAELIESHARWRALVESNHDLIVVVTRDLKIAFVNSAVERMFGYTVSEFTGSNPLSYVHPEDKGKAASMFAAVAAGLETPRMNEGRIRRADGTYAFMEAVPTRISWGKETAVLLNARDMSEQKQAQETIQHMAYHDSLTGLPNRLLLQDRLDTAIAQAKRDGSGVCVMSADIDRFKNVNDLLGHSAGDDLLRQVAGRLSRHVRDGDTVARTGGDEFVIVIPHCDSLDGARETARRLVENFRQPFRIGEHEAHVSISIGLAHYPEQAVDGEALINRADIALYLAKDSGRDTYRIFSEKTNTRSSEWLALEGDLRRALIDGELEVYYQPQVRVSDGEIVGAEALARWKHPTRGMISPSEFILLAEETGLINLLGDLVLSRACSEARTWPDHLAVAVNVSLRQFERPDFVERILANVKGTGLPFDRLELEITESTALRDINRTREMVNRLVASGIRFSIDDFGIGNTSLRHLRDLPLSKLKIDQSFMATLRENPANATIASSVISLGRKLNLTILAEGVETEEQLQFLREQGCDAYQGFVHSEALPAGEFRELLARAVRSGHLDPA